MTTSNSTADQVFDPQHAAELREKRKQTISNSLAKRHRKEKTFRFFGFSAVIAGLFFVALLFGSILSKGLQRLSSKRLDNETRARAASTKGNAS